MDSRERVYRSLEFRTPDRAPRDLWMLPWVHMFAAEDAAALQQDFPSDFTGPAGVLGKGDRQRGEEARVGTFVDAWGCEFVCGEDGVVGEVKHAPLAEDAAIDSYVPPREILERADWDAANRAQEENLASENPRFMRAQTSIRPWERMQFLRGTEQLMMDLAYDSAEFRRLKDIVHEFFMEELSHWVKTDCDGVAFMDDWGSQTSLLISPAMWREHFKPMYADYCTMIHDAGKKVFFHSDGYIMSIYEDLIEVGVDAVNSQLFCMDIEEIARQFKGRITFWGEIDRQHVLPFGTVADVRAAVARVRAALDDGRGGVIAQCEWGKDNTPENIRAVYEAWNLPIDEWATPPTA